jgi:spore maturation protein CgeB
MLKNVVMAYHDRPPIMSYLQKAFERKRVSARQFDMNTNHWFDKWVIHTVDKQLWNLRLLPKGRSAFEGHPLKHLQYRSTLAGKLVDEFKPELFLLIRGWRLNEETMQYISKKCTLIGWWLNSDSKKMDEVFSEIHHYDYYFFFNSSGIEEARKRGYENCELLQHAVDPESFYPIKNLSQKYDCCFVGGWSEKRQAVMEKTVEITGEVAIYGSKWGKRNLSNPKILKALKGDYIGGKELVELYNSSRIVLNITTWGTDAKSRSGINMRVFEVPACGAFLLTDGSRDLENAVTPGKHVVVYEDIQDFEGKLKYYLQNEDARRHIAEQGYNHVIKNHSYDNMVDKIIDAYNKVKKA